MKHRLIVLISGGGSNLQALIDAIAAKQLEAEIVLVVSNRKAAFGLERAKNAGIETLYFPLKPYKDAGRSREDYDTDLTRELEKHNPDLLILAGWMHIDSGVMCRTFMGRMINLHPALPGEFAGAHGIEDAFAAWQRGEISRSGCMVHEVIAELDAGAPIVTREIPFLENDTLETYATRVHKAEHEIIVEATQIFLKSYLRVNALAYIEDLDHDVLVFAAYDSIENPEHGLEIQVSTYFEEEDAELGMDTYCVISSDGATVYGGLEQCVVQSNMMTLILSKSASQQVNLPAKIMLYLDSPQETIQVAISGLQQIFERCKNPPRLDFQFPSQ